MLIRLVIACATLVNGVVAADEWNVRKDEAPVYSEPSIQSSVVGKLPKGKRIDVIDEDGNFFRLRSRSRRKLWVESANLERIVESEHYDLLEDVSPQFLGREPDFKRIRLDLGASGGRASNESFIEAAFGVEYFMMERLSWRNALFYRRPEVLSDSVGLDSSVRGNGRLPLGPLGLRGIIGAGYRFSTAGHHAPLLEVGGLAALKGFETGLMVKYLLNTVSNSARENVFIYSVVFSGTTGFL